MASLSSAEPLSPTGTATDDRNSLSEGGNMPPPSLTAGAFSILTANTLFRRSGFAIISNMKHKKAAKAEVSPEGVLTGGFRGKRPITRKQAWVIGGVCAAILAGVLAWSAYSVLKTSYKVPYDTSSYRYTQLKTLLSEPVPASDSEKVTYYSNIAGVYEKLSDYPKAIEAMLKADSYIKDRSIENGQTVNIALARYYQARGDKGKAREYYQREIDRIKSDPEAAENAEVIKYIEQLKGKV